MQEIVKREDQELINVIRNAAIKLWDAEKGPEVRACLDELERRHCDKGSVLARLARVEEDLTAFKRAHEGHSHELRPFALHTLAPTPDVHAPTPAQIGTSAQQARCEHNAVSKLSGRCAKCIVETITDMRNNAENRAWRCFEDWREFEIKKPENAGNVYYVQITPPVSADDWDAEIWFTFYSDRAHDGKGGTVRDLVVAKRGTSRVDALAHLASWCQAEMPLPGTCTCGPSAQQQSGTCVKCGKEAP